MLGGADCLEAETKAFGVCLFSDAEGASGGKRTLAPAHAPPRTTRGLLGRGSADLIESMSSAELEGYGGSNEVEGGEVYKPDSGSSLVPA